MFKCVFGVMIGLLVGLGQSSANQDTLKNAETAKNIDTTKVNVYKSTQCQHCNTWVRDMRDAGFDVQVHDVYDVDLMKERYHIPVSLHACHTSTINGYIIEGSVPPRTIKQLLKEQPDIKGLAMHDLDESQNIDPDQEQKMLAVAFDRSAILYGYPAN